MNTSFLIELTVLILAAFLGAEVISKVLLLARDDQIQDPNILDQIRAR